ncbi:MAG TPA: molybdopterin-dependent oxidoreductase [Longimicrobiales bacterium]|nr:molybdopterin-dependent oxidoreductase [Longimicrobiales bacterium]
MKPSRREFMRLAGGGGLAALLAACDWRGPESARPLLRAAEAANQGIEERLLRHLAMRNVADEGPLAGSALPRYFISPTVPMWDQSTRGRWTLEVAGLVRRPLRLTLDDLMRTETRTQRVDHYCVEGWTAITEWTGVRVSTLARAAGLMPEAAFVDFQSFDQDYHESWDLESAMHPQTLIAYGWEGRRLNPAHGAPARLHSPIKLGYKSVKYLTRVVFLPDNPGGYWSDRGYEWFAGL